MMKNRNLVSVIIVIFTLASCGGNNDQLGEQKEFINTESDNEDNQNEGETDYVSFDYETSRELEKYFAKDVLTKLDNSVSSFNDISTDTDFENYYNDAKKLFSDLYDALSKPATKFLIDLASKNEYWDPVDIIYDLQEFNGKIGPIQISCAAECSDIDFYFDLQILRKKAKESSGKADDDFMDLLISIEGDFGYAGYPGLKMWDFQTWDYGGASLIGNQLLFQTIEKKQKFEKKHKLFKAQMALFHADFLHSLSYSYIYQFNKEKVLKEFDQIINLNYFKGGELEDVIKLREMIENEEEGIQLGCENGNCEFG